MLNHSESPRPFSTRFKSLGQVMKLCTHKIDCGAAVSASPPPLARASAAEMGFDGSSRLLDAEYAACLFSVMTRLPRSFMRDLGSSILDSQREGSGLVLVVMGFLVKGGFSEESGL